MPQQATITEPPIGGTRAQALLGVNPAQLNRLREVGLLGDEDTLRTMQTEGGHWRYDEARVRELATRPWVDLPSPSPDLAVHLAPLTPDPLHRGGRRYQGWHVFAHGRELSVRTRGRGGGSVVPSATSGPPWSVTCAASSSRWPPSAAFASPRTGGCASN